MIKRDGGRRVVAAINNGRSHYGGIFRIGAPDGNGFPDKVDVLWVGSGADNNFVAINGGIDAGLDGAEGVILRSGARSRAVNVHVPGLLQSKSHR